MEVGVPQPVGTRWFRQAGGMAPPTWVLQATLLAGLTAASLNLATAAVLSPFGGQVATAGTASH